MPLLSFAVISLISVSHTTNAAIPPCADLELGCPAAYDICLDAFNNETWLSEYGPNCRVCGSSLRQQFDYRECVQYMAAKDPPECCYIGGPGSKPVVNAIGGVVLPMVFGGGQAGSTIEENGYAYGFVARTHVNDKLDKLIGLEPGAPHCLIHRHVLDRKNGFYDTDAMNYFYYPPASVTGAGFPLYAHHAHEKGVYTGSMDCQPWTSSAFVPSAMALVGLGVPQAHVAGLLSQNPSFPDSIDTCQQGPWGKANDESWIGEPMAQFCGPNDGGWALERAQRIAQVTFDIYRNPDLSCRSDNFLSIWKEDELVDGMPSAANGTSNPDCIARAGNACGHLSKSAYCIEQNEATAAAFIAEWKLERAGITGDPHFTGFDGDKLDFRGKNDTVYSLLSARRFQLNARFISQTFVMGGTCDRCPKRKTVHGSFVKVAYLRALTSTDKTLTIEYRAGAPSHAVLTTKEADGVSMTTDVEVSTTMPDATQYTVDEVSLRLVRKHQREVAVVVSNGEIEVQATSRYLAWAAQNGFKKRLDVTLKSLRPTAALKVWPHGLIGQTLDGDQTAVDGAMDDYSPTEVLTAAMGEGAIEGVAADYEVPADDPFSTVFKYSRFYSLAAPPRDASKLTGVRRKNANAPTIGAAAAADGDDASGAGVRAANTF